VKISSRLLDLEIWFFTKSSAISPKVLNLFEFIDCTKAMPVFVLYYRNFLFQLMCKICLAGFAHCAIVVKQWCWLHRDQSCFRICS
jgi:hypothetical protein